MAEAKLSGFAQWDLSAPVQTRPCLLYALTPCGLGTPYVESLASYVTRLAEAHVVSVWRLILQIRSTSRPEGVPRSSLHYAYPVNGLGKDSEVLLRNLEVATGRSDLHLLTLSTLDGCISRPSIFRTSEAWCSGCLADWCAAGAPVYCPLLWALRVAKVCPVHYSPLRDRCPHCQSRFATLRARALPGYCSNCSQWLGTSDSPVTNRSMDDDKYDLWVATSVGELLAVLPRLESSCLATALRANLQKCLHQSEGATKENLAALARAGPCTFQTWISGRVRPTLDHLCRLAYQLKLPLIQLFQGVPAEWRGPDNLGPDISRLRGRLQSHPRIEPVELRHILTAVLTENPAPSVAEVARRLKFRRTQTLVSREHEFCRQIALRRRQSGLRPSATRQLYPRSERRRVEAILRTYLAEESPPSINEIASKMGYLGNGGIRERFPDLCHAIVAKRQQQVLRKKEEMRRALEEACAEAPPPSLKQIGHRLGYTTESVVVGTFPDLCNSYKERRKRWSEDHRNRLGRSIRQWLAAEAQPTVSSVCRTFGISAAYFQEHFPEENAEVVQRSAERARKAREANAVALQEEVFTVVRELLQRNLYPSLPRVRAGLGPELTKYYPLLRPAINSALSRFGSVVRPRNELGQFV
jgi:TniQ